MKKHVLHAMLAIASLMSVSGIAQAAEGYYVGLNSGVYNMNLRGANLKGTTIGGTGLIGGYDLGEAAAFELRASTTFNEKNIVANAATTTTLGIDYAISYLVKPYYELPSQDLSVYALLGGTTTAYRAKGAGFSNKINKTSFSYGVGFEGVVTHNYIIGIEWFRPATNVALDSFSKLTVDTFTLTNTYKF